MKSSFVLPLLAVAMLSCNGNKANTEAKGDVEAEESNIVTEGLSLDGKWRLNDFAGESEVQQMDADANYYLTFNAEDHTFGLNTDCNSIGGEYKVVGDSLLFENIAMTQMACPNETVERGMSAILPMVTTYVITPDSALILRSDARTMATFTYAGK